MIHAFKRRLAGGGLALIALAPLFLFTAHAAPVIPAPPVDGYILDLADIIPEESEALLEQHLLTLENETSNEIAVVTVPDLQGYAIEEFTLELAREWGVGQKELDNGLVLLVAPTEREVRIEVGYGLEGAVTDYNSSLIINEVMIPYFKEGQYDLGIEQGVYYLEDLARGEEFNLAPVQNSFNFFDSILVFLVYLLPFGYILIAMMSQSRSWWLGGVIFGAVGFMVGSLMTQPIMGIIIGAIGGLGLDYILSTVFFGKFKMPKGGKGGFGGGFSGGGGGGGISFGGGSFGGGGSSGSW